MSTTALDARPTTVYRLFDDEDRLLYVGIAADPVKRCGEHRSQFWWGEVADFTFTEYPDRAAAQEAELDAIRTEEPRYNDCSHAKSARKRSANRVSLYAAGKRIHDFDLGDPFDPDRLETAAETVSETLRLLAEQVRNEAPSNGGTT